MLQSKGVLSFRQVIKAQTVPAKYQYKLLRDQKNNIIDNNGEDGDNKKNIKVVKILLLIFDTILKDVKNNGKTTKSITFTSHGNNNNLHSLKIKLLNAEKTALRKNY